MTDMREYLKTDKMVYDSYFDEFVASDDFEDYAVCLLNDGWDVSKIDFYTTKLMKKPFLSFDKLKDSAIMSDYYMDDDDCLMDENEEVLAEINRLYQSLLSSLYKPTNEKINVDIDDFSDRYDVETQAWI